MRKDSLLFDCSGGFISDHFKVCVHVVFDGHEGREYCSTYYIHCE